MNRLLYLYPKERAGVTYPYVYWDNLFTNEELQKVIDYCETLEKIQGTTVGKNGEQLINNEARVSTIAWGFPQPESEWIFQRLLFVVEQLNAKFYEFDLNGFESFQYTVYNANNKNPGKYEYHMDTIMGLDKPIEMAETRKLSLSIILSDPSEYEGGEFYIQTGSPDEDKLLKMDQVKGRVLAFPSFMIHKVAPITKGTRRSIVVWVEGPKFK